jgi:hypothetical protein
MNLTVVILCDDGYGMIRWKQANMGFTDFGLDYGNPDFVKYAEAYGANGYRVECADALLPQAHSRGIATMSLCYHYRRLNVGDIHPSTGEVNHGGGSSGPRMPPQHQVIDEPLGDGMMQRHMLNPQTGQ